MTIPDKNKPVTGGQQPPKQTNKQPARTDALSDSSHSEESEESIDSQALSSEGLPPFSTLEEVAPDFDFPLMEDDVAAFRRELDALKFASVEQAPEDEPVSVISQAPRRRRRSARVTERISAGDLGARLESIAQRTSPTFDFFAFSFLCACILGIGYILDAPAILVIGIFVAPLLAPWVGAVLSAATGEFQLFRQTSGGMFIGLTMVFAIGVLAGLASRIFQPITSSQAFYHARLWWPDLLMLVIGTIILMITFIQSDDKPIIASLMVAYEIFLPVSAAGFGLGSGVQGLWPEAGLVFLIHLALSLIISLIIFFYMGFHPLEIRGYALTAGLVLIGLVILAGFAGLGSLINVRGDQTYATSIAVNSPTPQKSVAIKTAALPTKPNPTLKPSLVPSATPSVTPHPPSATKSTVSATLSVTPGPTLLPTPVYGKVQSQSGGVMVRAKPGGTSIATVTNGYLVEILGDTPVVIDGEVWVHVIVSTTTNDINGWVLLALIVTATPSFSP